MILGSLQNTEKFESLHPLLKKVFEFIRTSDFSMKEDGVIKTDDPHLFYVLTTLHGVEKKDVKLESHTKYIDIHFPLLGVEKVGWKSAEELMLIATPYNEEKDITFYIDKPTTYLKIYPGHFVVFFPDDAHATGIGEGLIRKIVAKVALEEALNQ